MKEVVSYSPNTIKAQNFLKRLYNDIDIVVEDTANRNVWYFLVRACLPDHIKLESITLAGGRAAVEAACKANQQVDGRPTLYITDGDFDFLLGKRKKRLRNLYRIKAFNVENLVFNNHAIPPIALASDPLCDPDVVLQRHDVEMQISLIGEMLRPLFEIYAVSERLGAGIPTCGFNVEQLVVKSNRGIRLDQSLVAARMISVARTLLRQHGKSKVRSELDEVRSRSKPLPVSMIVSGKAYLLPIVHSAVQKRFGYRGNREMLKVALMMNSKGVEPYLKRRLTTLLNANPCRP